MKRRLEKIRETGILKTTGKSIPFHILILICSNPKVLKIAPRIDNIALISNPAYKIDSTGVINEYINIRINFMFISS